MGRDLRVHSVPTRAERFRTYVEVVAIVAAGLWALYTFVYLQYIKPLGEAPSFSVSTTVDQGSTVSGVTFLTIHKRLENTGNVPIDIAAEALSVYGERIVTRAKRNERIETPAQAEVSADVPRQPIAFYVPPHSSNEEAYLVAVPARVYPVVRIVRKDYIEKAPIDPKIPVQIVRTRLGGYDLRSPQLVGEYDSSDEYPIRP